MTDRRACATNGVTYAEGATADACSVVTSGCSHGEASCYYWERALRRGVIFFFFQAEDGIRDYKVTGVQTCALPICQGVTWWTIRSRCSLQPHCLARILRSQRWRLPSLRRRSDAASASPSRCRADRKSVV